MFAAVKNMFIFSACLFISAVACQTAAASQEYSSIDASSPTNVSSEGLTDRERAALEKQYQFEVRGKSRLLIPSSGASGEDDGKSFALPDGDTQYYKYLKTAIDLYKAGRLEESGKVLKYLNGLDPQDEYVKLYLGRVTKELSSRGRDWKKEASSEASKMKQERVSALLREGDELYKDKDYDGALVRFQDVLAVDPGNAKASAYMQKLKAHYLKKIEVESIVSGWKQNGKEGSEYAAPEAKPAPAGPIGRSAEAMLNDAEIKKIAFDRRAKDFLAETSFGFEVDAIISARRSEEARKNQMMLGVGDVVMIAVLDHPELSGAAAVQSNGAVSLPLVGDEIEARGLTVNELGEKVAKALDSYVDKPRVSVYITASKSQTFYVIDEIGCTPYPITRPDLTLRDALFLSDWGDSRALGRVLVMKPSTRNPVIKKIDAFNIIFRGDLRDNVRISNGDVIYIPLTMASKITKTVYDTLSPLRAAMAARDQYLNTKWNTRDYEEFFRMPATYDDESRSAQNADSNTNLNISYLNLGR